MAVPSPGRQVHVVMPDRSPLARRPRLTGVSRCGWTTDRHLPAALTGPSGRCGSPQDGVRNLKNLLVLQISTILMRAAGA